MGQMSSIWADGCMLMIVCVVLTWHDYPSLVEVESHCKLLLKPAVHSQVGKTKLFINCFHNPTSNCATEKRRKHNCTLETNPAFQCQTRCTEDHSTVKPEPAGKTLKIGTFYILILQTPMDELRPQLGMLNSSRSRWKLAEKRVIRVRINRTTY